MSYGFMSVMDLGSGVGAGWARAHSAPVVLGEGIRADPKSFFGGLGADEGGRSQATNLRRKVFVSCKLFVYTPCSKKPSP